MPQRFIRLVASRTGGKTRPRVFYATVTVAVVMAIIVGQIVLSVMVSSGAYEISSLQEQHKDLSRNYAAVSQTLAQVSSAQHVAASAENLGMVSSNAPAYLQLSTNKVLGQPRAATGSGALLSGANASLVQNILLTDIPAGAVPAAAAAARAAGKSPITGVAAGATSGAVVALPGASSQTIPTPQTR
jgi:hypothetical protein